MSHNFIKAKLRELLIEARALEEDLADHLLNVAYSESLDDDEKDIQSLLDAESRYVEPFEYVTESLFLTTVCLLDSLGLQLYLTQFYQKFGKKFNSTKAAKDFVFGSYWVADPYSTFLADIRQFLMPLGILDDNSIYLKTSGISYLETILKNTATIVHKSGRTPVTETEVSKIARDVLEVIFPSAIKPKSNFFKKAQEYKPDILIPELSAAVEYKYATDEVKLKATIGQISDDVKGYTGDSDYNLFYAVFYVTNDFWGEEAFRHAWNEKEFPPNWQAFYIVGR